MQREAPQELRFGSLQGADANGGDGRDATERGVAAGVFDEDRRKARGESLLIRLNETAQVGNGQANLGADAVRVIGLLDLWVGRKERAEKCVASLAGELAGRHFEISPDESVELQNGRHRSARRI